MIVMRKDKNDQIRACLEHYYIFSNFISENIKLISVVFENSRCIIENHNCISEILIQFEKITIVYL